MIALIALIALIAPPSICQAEEVKDSLVDEKASVAFFVPTKCHMRSPTHEAEEGDKAVAPKAKVP